ncbi:MAG: alpha/beta hydrolase [Rhodospirillales bacterium]|nr:MAG: alpha/beta hydrolase [Rhodospirillales bacterium]
MTTISRSVLLRATAATALVAAATGTARAQTSIVADPGDARIHYRTVEVDGVDVFYREAGRRDAPTIVLLHGFPTSSQQYRNLIPALADRYRVIAPDYPGYGRSAMPDRARFDYSFENYGRIVGALLRQLGVARYALYVMDYGAPVGWRVALAHPERVSALIVQNGNAYDEGLLGFWDAFKAYWRDGRIESREKLRQFLALAATEWQYTHGEPDKTLVSPDAWMLDQVYLDRPGNQEIQLDLFYDYRKNVALYPQVQAYFRKHQPPTLILWGKRDQIFPAPGGQAYLRDLPRAELHMLDAGHFALETKGPEMAAQIRDFLGRTIR